MTMISPIRFAGTIKGTHNGSQKAIEGLRQTAEAVGKNNPVFVDLDIVKGDHTTISVNDSGNKTTDQTEKNSFVFKTSSRSDIGRDPYIDIADKQILAYLTHVKGVSAKV